MNNYFSKYSAALLLGAIVVFPASVRAIPIDGSIQFVGGATMNPEGTAIISYTGPVGYESGPSVLAGSQSGSYAGIANGTIAAWTPFTFNPASASVTPLWTIVIGSTTYSFDATSMVISYPNSTTLNISGDGIAHITGLDDTSGIWTVTDTGYGMNFTFGASTTAAGSVADGTTTVMLLGAALFGVVLMHKKTPILDSFKA